jgi:hypothetical protein
MYPTDDHAPGSTNEWATPKDQEVYFADFSMGILDTF